jgi:catechol 2,3-dioxygenase-like lactoylglutathione lyase family enzyme
MINHLSIGVRDVARSGKFYVAVLKPLGYTRLSDGETSLGFGDKSVVLWVQKSDSPVPADMASGLHFCFDAPTRKSVDAFYKAALAAGGKDNGPAGLRADYGDNYYAGFVIDPDGYRLEAYCDKAS